MAERSRSQIVVPLERDDLIEFGLEEGNVSLGLTNLLEVALGNGNREAQVVRADEGEMVMIPGVGGDRLLVGVKVGDGQAVDLEYDPREWRVDDCAMRLSASGSGDKYWWVSVLAKTTTRRHDVSDWGEIVAVVGPPIEFRSAA